MKVTPIRAARIAQRSYLAKTLVVNEVEILIEDFMAYQVVAFRGTEATSLNVIFRKGGWRDILRDLRFIPWFDERVGWAHSGFLKGAQAAVDEMIRINLPKKETIVIGHSLGGGLAVIAALLLKARGVDVTAVYTFGAPRAVFKGALDKLNALNIFQFINGSDLVTTLPHRFTGMRHAAAPIHIGEEQSKSTWDDHPIEKYIEKLNES